MNENDASFIPNFEDSATLSEVITSTRASLNQAVERRKQVERDAQLLANRIQLLKNEEAKAMMNIAITKARVSQTEAVRREAALREAERYNLDRKRQEEISLIQQRNAYLRDVSKANRESSIKQVQQAKVRSAIEMKSTIRTTATQRLHEEANERLAASRRTDMIRQERIESKRRIQEEKCLRLRQYQKEFETRLLDEEKQKLKAESVLSQLEREEMELIKRLERAQKHQSIMYEELNSTLPSTPLLSGRPSPSPRVGFSSARVQHLASPTVSSLSRREIGGAALR